MQNDAAALCGHNYNAGLAAAGWTASMIYPGDGVQPQCRFWIRRGGSWCQFAVDTINWCARRPVVLQHESASSSQRVQMSKTESSVSQPIDDRLASNRAWNLCGSQCATGQVKIFCRRVDAGNRPSEEDALSSPVCPLPRSKDSAVAHQPRRDCRVHSTSCNLSSSCSSWPNSSAMVT